MVLLIGKVPAIHKYKGEWSQKEATLLRFYEVFSALTGKTKYQFEKRDSFFKTDLLWTRCILWV
jgi:hypothetical protein